MVADPSRILGRHNTQVDVGLCDASTPTVEPSKDFDDIFEFMSNRDGHHILVTDLTYAVQVRINLHSRFTVTQALIFDRFGALF